MKAIVTGTKDSTRFFLTPEGYASDIPDRAKIFRDSFDAQYHADEVNQERAFKMVGMRWEAAYMLHDGSIALGEPVL